MSDLLKAMHETAKGLYDAGVMDACTMRQIEELCLTSPEKMDAEEIKQLRLSHKVSQAVFAQYLNVKSVTVRKWELGTNRPSGPALKLLHLIKQKGLEPLQF
jgi:putative transcriptional regulator